MELYALIKSGKNIEEIDGRIISQRTNIYVREIITNFINEIISRYGMDHIVCLDDLELIRDNNDKFSMFTADKILKLHIMRKNRSEVKRALINLFSTYYSDKSVYGRVISGFDIYKYFYSDRHGNMVYNRHVIKSVLERTFYMDKAIEMEEKLYNLTKTGEYKMDLTIKDLQAIVESEEDIVNVNRENFEELLHAFKIISDPKAPAGRRHKCYSCSLLSPLTCEKAEYIKKLIEHYPYILSGYQIIEVPDHGVPIIDSFIVTSCRNYKRANEFETVVPEDYEAQKKENQKTIKKSIFQTEPKKEILIGAPSKVIGNDEVLLGTALKTNTNPNEELIGLSEYERNKRNKEQQKILIRKRNRK